MSIIPQDPLLLELSIRDNLDLDKSHTDAEIWQALDRAECRKFIEALPGKLDHEVSSSVSFTLHQVVSGAQYRPRADLFREGKDSSWLLQEQSSAIALSSASTRLPALL